MYESGYFHNGFSVNALTGYFILNIIFELEVGYGFSLKTLRSLQLHACMQVHVPVQCFHLHGVAHPAEIQIT